MSVAPGIRRRHARGCPAAGSDDMDACRCRPSYQAQAGPRKHRQTRTWPTLSAAKAWKRDVDGAWERGEVPGSAPTLREAAEEWLDLADRGIVLARGDRPYRPSTLRGYRRAMENELLGVFGDRRLDQLGRGELNRFVEGLQARGLAASTVRNVVIPLRALYRRAHRDLEVVASNPTVGVKVPGGSGRRMAVASLHDIGRCLAALEPGDRAVWATAFYAGLRRGELQALRWADVDLAGGVITVRMSYDAPSGTMGPVKSDAGQDRRVPVAGPLRDALAEHRQRAGRATGLCFARGVLAGTCRVASRARPFSDSALSLRARTAWARAGVPPVTLHDCRHTFASVMIEAMATAGTFNPKVIQGMLGHASIQQTYDRYGHLFPGAEAEAGRMLDRMLDFDKDSDSELGAAAGRFLAVLGESDQIAALPVVAQLREALRSWEHESGVIPSVACNPQAAGERRVSVQRNPPGRVG